MPIKLSALCAFGIEAVLARELSALGFESTSENGRLTVSGEWTDIPKLNMHLRTAERVVVELATFPAPDFDALFEGTLSVNWPDILPENAVMHVIGRSHNSKLHGVPACQGMVKKAMITSMQKRYKRERFPEDGPLYRVEIAIRNDIASLTLDTTGDGLHARGYRAEALEAPIKETLASALILLSNWRPPRPFADPLCGSGTIAIEAALIARNIAPGMKRRFSADRWPIIDAREWGRTREEALSRVTAYNGIIHGSDIDENAVTLSAANAARAGVAENIRFARRSIHHFKPEEMDGVIVTNPPYGERVGEEADVEALYRAMGESFRALNHWSYFIITSHERFEHLFGERAKRNRKLYNGAIKCYYYQYPRKKPIAVGSGEHLT
ncbi:MAG: class I SAM-dependent RNA methyltransferase [Spirochaetota bacterium]